MFSEQQGRGMPARSQAGQLTRRDLLQRAVALGAGGSAMLALLEACGTTPSVDLTYWNLFGGGDGVRMEQMEGSYSAHYPQVSLESIVLAWGPPYYTKLA
ncbi:MAG TPA: ABC transporter substrate-binding protein, partial [Ktedonobacteraceae bacterium]|nr:ABC transporter substrate-binding protein [Ktedonobacteraceae bacterium]